MGSDDPERNPWVTHSSETKYENPWIRVVENQVTNPAGGDGIYGVVHFAHRAVGVIPIDEENHTWLVGQFRYPGKSYEWEIIEGGAKPDEQLLESAQRELSEEAGIAASDYRLILSDIQLSNSVSDELGYVFVARGLTFHDAEPEETEELSLRRVPLEEAFRMVADGEIRDSLSVMGLLKLQVGLPLPAQPISPRE